MSRLIIDANISFCLPNYKEILLNENKSSDLKMYISLREAKYVICNCLHGVVKYAEIDPAYIFDNLM